MTRKLLTVSSLTLLALVVNSPSVRASPKDDADKAKSDALTDCYHMYNCQSLSESARWEAKRYAPGGMRDVNDIYTKNKAAIELALTPQEIDDLNTYCNVCKYAVSDGNGYQDVGYDEQEAGDYEFAYAQTQYDSEFYLTAKTRFDLAAGYYAEAADWFNAAYPYFVDGWINGEAADYLLTKAGF